MKIYVIYSDHRWNVNQIRIIECAFTSIDTAMDYCGKKNTEQNEHIAAFQRVYHYEEVGLDEFRKMEL